MALFNPGQAVSTVDTGDWRAGRLDACWLPVLVGWMARIEIVNSWPKEMNASIAGTHQFHGFLGSSVVNLWHISTAHRGYLDTHGVHQTRASAFGNTLRTATVMGQNRTVHSTVPKSAGPAIKGEGAREQARPSDSLDETSLTRAIELN